MNPVIATFFALIAVRIACLVVEMMGTAERPASLGGALPALRLRR